MKTKSFELSPSYPFRIAVISDTHTTRQLPDFHPALLSNIKETSPNLILHAGDITLPDSLEVLNSIAPTYAVRGNRDIFGFSDLPDIVQIQIGRLLLLMSHGHGPLLHYLVDKAKYMTIGYRFERYQEYLESIQPPATINIFGHTHVPVNKWIDGKLFLNPGTAGYPVRGYSHATMAWITLKEDGSILSSIQDLEQPEALFP